MAASKRQILAYIRKAAKARGIDPNTAVRVAKSEGMGPDTTADDGWQSNYKKNGVREPSYGPYQLYMGGGLGNQFQEVTGYHPSDTASVFMQVDFALDKAAQEGWGAWYGAGRVGIGKWKGLKGAQPAGITATYGDAPVPSEDIPNTSLAGTYGTLRLNKRPKVDERVKFLQKTLNDQFGFDLETDGRFGPATDAAVKALQKTMGLEADGIVGRDTWGGIETVVRPDMSLEARDARALSRATPGVTGNAISTRSQQPTARLPAPQPQRPSPFEALSEAVTRPAGPQGDLVGQRRMEDQAVLNARLAGPMAALSGISTRPAQRPSPLETPGGFKSPRAVYGDINREIDAHPVVAASRQVTTEPGRLSPEYVRSDSLAAEKAAATQELRDNLKRPIDYIRPRPNPMRARLPEPLEAARFEESNRAFPSVASPTDAVYRPSPATGARAAADLQEPATAAAASARPTPAVSPAGSFMRGWQGVNYAPLDKRMSQARDNLDALTRSMGPRPSPASISDLVRGGTTTPARLDRSSPAMGARAASGLQGYQRPSPSISDTVRASSGSRAITAPLPRPRPAVAARPSPAPVPRQPTREEAFVTRDADAFAGLSRPSLVRSTASAPPPIPRPSPLAPGATAAASARRVTAAPRPTPRPSSSGTVKKASTLDRVKSTFARQDASRSMKDRVRASRL